MVFKVLISLSVIVYVGEGGGRGCVSQVSEDLCSSSRVPAFLFFQSCDAYLVLGLFFQACMSVLVLSPWTV